MISLDFQPELPKLKARGGEKWGIMEWNSFCFEGLLRIEMKH
jgi:hypothetical protein